MRKILSIFFSFFVILSSLQVSALTTSGNQIIGSDGVTPIELKGINWFGFNNGQTMVDGLYAGPDGLSLDFATVAYRLQLLGFNAVRLPFSFQNLYDLSPINYTRNALAASSSEIQASVTDPSVSVPPGAKIPPQVYSPTEVAGEVNSYLPNDTTLNRFLWVVNFFARNGFYVLIDDHAEDPTVLQNQTQWLQYWVQLVTAISQDPISKSKLMIDILNEPDGFGIRWAPSGNTPGLTNLYLSVMDAVYPINPNILFFVEGTGQGGIQANWGDGFATNENLIAQYGLSDPNPFFQALLTKPYLNQVVISPHVYPPSVTGATTDYEGPGLWNRLSESFGYLTQAGYSSGSSPAKVFPVAVGEFGSMFATSKDIQSMTDIASYLNNKGGAADGLHKAIPNWFYWDWNANSGDTGGLVENDWRTIIWQKVEYLVTLALQPWYLGSLPPPEFGTLSLEIASVDGLPASSLKPITVGNYTFNITAFNTLVSQSVAVGNYTINAPSITVGNIQFNAPSQMIAVSENQTTDATVTYVPTAISQGTCTVNVQLGTPWQSNGLNYNVINLYVKNNGATTIAVPWKLTITNGSYKQVQSSWNMTINSNQKGTISATVSSSWETLSPNGGDTVNVGLIVSSTSTNFMPTSITVNGSPATITSQ